MNIKRTILASLVWLPIFSSVALAGSDQCCGYYSTGNMFSCTTHDDKVSHGNCTWWAAYKRPDLNFPKIPGVIGNRDAGNWIKNASKMGYVINKDYPVVGSIVVFDQLGGQGHVAYVEKVLAPFLPAQASFDVSEMGYNWFDGTATSTYYATKPYYYQRINATKASGLAEATHIGGFIYPTRTILHPDGVLVMMRKDGKIPVGCGELDKATFYNVNKKDGTVHVYLLTRDQGRQLCEEGFEFYHEFVEVSLGWAISGLKGIIEQGGLGGGPGTSTPPDPTDPPASGKLPDFITNKVILAKENGKGERYTWKVNETAWVHAWVDNIGKANWEGKKDKIKVPFYLSKGTKKDSSSEWVRVGREEIKKKNVEVKDKPKHEKIAFNIPQWAAAGYIYPGRTYNFVVCADRPKDQDNGDGDVKEIHKSNNCSTPAVFYVDYGPARNVDVMASNLALAGGKSSLQAGEAYGFQADISNIGTQYPWNGCRTSYEIKGPGTGGVWQKVADEGSTAAQLGPNSTHVEVIDESRGLKAPAVGGDYVFRACADYEQAIPETDESNNCTAELPVTVTVPPPPSVTPRIVITNPTHDDDWRSDETDHDVRWDYFDFPEKGHVKVEYSLDGGATWLLIDDETTNDGKKHWEDMCDFHTIDTHHAYIRVTSLEYPEATDISDEFSIDHARGCK